MTLVDAMFARLPLSPENLKTNSIESLSRCDVKARPREKRDSRSFQVFLVSLRAATILRERTKAIRRGMPSPDRGSAAYPALIADLPLDDVASRFWTAIVALVGTPPT